jgi:hypothetical protein
VDAIAFAGYFISGLVDGCSLCAEGKENPFVICCLLRRILAKTPKILAPCGHRISSNAAIYGVDVPIFF